MSYPPNTPSPKKFTAKVTCRNSDCEWKWAVEFVTDLGMTDPVNYNDMICPECGREGE